jgi:transcriptional regulator with XRE-family HTH domain
MTRTSIRATPKKIGAYARQCREKAGMSQWAAAERSGLSANCISGIECGKTNSRIPTLVKLASAYKLKASDFFKGAGL